jgi:nicotinamide riboside transporter PnuC
MWGVTGLSVIGTILNIKKKKICFIIWFVTNSLWAGYDFYIKDYPQSLLFLIYVGLSVYGIISWSKNK